ncbi:MAG: hypothetical protein MJ061_03155, partial [Mailhella sp.]|nr:hypothetical protein [Mailhella sp.]
TYLLHIGMPMLMMPAPVCQTEGHGPCRREPPDPIDPMDRPDARPPLLRTSARLGAHAACAAGSVLEAPLGGVWELQSAYDFGK